MPDIMWLEQACPQEGESVLTSHLRFVDVVPPSAVLFNLVGRFIASE